MRGETNFKNDIKEPGVQQTRKRSNKLRLQRNECLADRYYYFSHFTDKRYNIIIENIMSEFFLSRETISDIIQSQSAYLVNLKKNKPGIFYFQNKWGHLIWKI